MVEDIVVVVPSYNNLTIKGKESLDMSINSIKVSIDHLKALFPNVIVYISWVDDASKDGTAEYIEEKLKSLDIPFKFESLKVNSHQGYCRNHGVRAFNTKYITFCDSDDEWFPPHLAQLYECITAKDSHGRDICAVSSLVYTDPDLQVHPDWVPRISGTIPFNKMIRREVFDFIEGFPVNDVFKKQGCEDQVFIQLVNRFFHVVTLGVFTVKYHNYKNSFFDKQLKKFRLHPAYMGLAMDDYTEDKRRLDTLINKFHEEKIEYLKGKLTYLDLNRSFENLCAKFI